MEGQESKNSNMAPEGITFVSPQISYGLENSGQELNRPYWLDALIEEQTNPNGYLDVINSTGGGFQYSFPEVQPDYLSNASDVNGWSVVTDEVKIASRDIFSSLCLF